MRTFCFIVAFVFFFMGPSLSSPDQPGLPGIGTFSYNGSPLVTDVPKLTVVAAR